MNFSLLIYLNNNSLYVSNRLSSSGGILPYMQRMVFIMHLSWLTVSTIRVPPTHPPPHTHTVLL